ncbi:MAG TPA: ATP-binding cassette domain-containing protein [Mycobacteriales bacterium]
MGATDAVVAEDLHKRFGSTHALRGVSLRVPAGTVCGLLGPNGAGKTTVVRIVTTLLRADSGTASVNGYDVMREPSLVRRSLGLAGQAATVDGLLSGRVNLVMIGKLYHLSNKVAKARADELLERFSLTDAADRIAKTYSGGMRRRLDLAASLVAAPPVLVLDEPTTGLDPHARAETWAVIDGLVRGGTTLLLTTQYLEEADQLADQIVVVDHGTVVADGTPAQLKDEVGGRRLEVAVTKPDDLAPVRAVLARHGAVTVDEDAMRLSIDAPEGAKLVSTVAAALEAERIEVDDIGLHRPSLDEVFLRLTGNPPAPATEEQESA